MDGSFLSQAAVIEASRRFVCVRLLTYEDDAEAKFLKSLFISRSGDLENTLFAILAPDGKRVLVKAHRSPRHEFADAAQLAETMNRVAAPYAGSKQVGTPPLPLLPTMRLALNTAACDNRPLAAIVSEDAEVRKRLEAMLAELAWTETHRGRLIYGAAAAKELAAVKGREAGSALLVIQPDPFGRSGTVLAQIHAKATREEISAVLSKGAGLHERRSQSFSAHVREGHQLGIFWETAIPVTDPLERNARERGRK